MYAYLHVRPFLYFYLLLFFVFIVKIDGLYIYLDMQMILDAIEQVGGIYVVTADHGNAEDMVKRNKSGQPALDKNGNIQVLTSHTLQPVCNFLSFSSQCQLRKMHLG